MYFAAIHLFTRSKTKSRISFSPVKKPVAATAVLATSYIIKILSRQVPHTHNVICKDILMTCAVNSIFDCAGVCYIIHFTNNKEPAIPIFS